MRACVYGCASQWICVYACICNSNACIVLYQSKAKHMHRASVLHAECTTETSPQMQQSQRLSPNTPHLKAWQLTECQLCSTKGQRHTPKWAAAALCTSCSARFYDKHPAHSSHHGAHGVTSHDTSDTVYRAQHMPCHVWYVCANNNKQQRCAGLEVSCPRCLSCHNTMHNTSTCYANITHSCSQNRTAGFAQLLQCTQ